MEAKYKYKMETARQNVTYYKTEMLIQRPTKARTLQHLLVTNIYTIGKF